MKAQGLPLNFIVLAAIAILILILAVAFVIGGGAAVEGSIGPAAAASNCQRWCSDLQAHARWFRNKDAMENYEDETQPEGDINHIATSTFCTREQVVEGQPEVTCDQLNVQCLLIFGDGSSSYASC